MTPCSVALALAPSASDAELMEHANGCDDCARSMEASTPFDRPFVTGPLPAVPRFDAARLLVPQAMTHRRRVVRARRALPMALAAGVAVLVTASTALFLTRGGDESVAIVPGEALVSTAATRLATLPSGVRLTLESGRA